MQAAAPSIANDPGHTAYYRRVLHELIDLGAGLARQVHAAASAVSPSDSPLEPGNPEPTRPQPDAAALDGAVTTFDRIARAVRRTILLAQTLESAPQLSDRAAIRTKIIRSVEDSIYADAAPADAEALHAEFRERLDRPEFEHDIQTRPIDDVISDIRRDLGLDFAHVPDLRLWKRRSPAEVAVLHARAAAPPGGASNPAFAIAWPAPKSGKPTSSGVTKGLENLAVHLASTRYRGK